MNLANNQYPFEKNKGAEQLQDLGTFPANGNRKKQTSKKNPAETRFVVLVRCKQKVSKWYELKVEKPPDLPDAKCIWPIERLGFGILAKKRLCSLGAISWVRA